MTTNISSKPSAGKTAESSRENEAAGPVFAVLMAHAPILVPEVGGDRACAAQASQRAMREAAECVAGFRPDAVVLNSPHSPRRARAFGVWVCKIGSLL